MKNIYTFSILALFALPVFAQVTSRSPIIPGSEWRVNHATGGIGEDPIPVIVDEIIKYHLNGDTTIGEHTYFKLNKSGVAYYDIPFYFNNVYVGAIRSDSNKIFYIRDEELNETVIYDFNLKLGDTIGTNTVLDIDTLPDGRYAFTLGAEISICGPEVIVEGIGGTGGLIHPAPCPHLGNQGYYLVCYSENGNIKYEPEWAGYDFSCEMISGIYPVKEQRNEFEVYPVPAADRILIKRNVLNDNPVTVEIFNPAGIRVTALKIPNLTGNDLFEFPVSHLEKGVYLCRILSSDSSFEQKIIIK